ncbi:MAG: hypothetical protein VW378_07755 [bacterium]
MGMKWNDLPRNEQGLVKLSDKGDSLLTLLRMLEAHGSHFVRTVTATQLENMTEVGPFQTLPSYLLMPLYESRQADKKRVTLVFSNHGQIHFCKDEYLSDYRFEHADFYWNFSLSGLVDPPKESVYADSYCLSADSDAIQQWQATFYLERIFDYYGFNGADEMAPLVGFFYIK